MTDKKIKIINFSFITILFFIISFMFLVVWAVFDATEKKGDSPFYSCTMNTAGCLLECLDKYESETVLKLSCGASCSMNMGYCNILVYGNWWYDFAKGEKDTFFPSQNNNLPDIKDKDSIKQIFDDIPDDLKKMSYKEFISLEEKNK